jgi:hypothetical protein
MPTAQRESANRLGRPLGDGTVVGCVGETGVANCFQWHPKAARPKKRATDPTRTRETLEKTAKTKKNRASRGHRIWSGRRESNPRLLLGSKELVSWTLAEGAERILDQHADDHLSRIEILIVSRGVVYE